MEDANIKTETHYTDMTEPDRPSTDLRDWRQELNRRLVEADGFRALSLDVARTLHQQILRSENGVRDLVDILHGKQLGHPLHPVLTDLTVGSWSLAFFFDMLSLLPGGGFARKVADSLTLIGTFSAIPTALSGMTDYTTIKRDAASTGALHGILNSIAFFCYMRSTVERLTGGSRMTALLYAVIGVAVVTVSAWLGGDLVYYHRVGINHVHKSEVPEWTQVMALEDLPEQELTRVEAHEVPVLLFRRGVSILAINAVCSHAGGPLEEGRVVDKVCVQCPWHQSVFDMVDGDVVHAPATYSQPIYAVRIRDGQIEVRSSK